MKVLLDEETHVYTVDGVPKRSLSSLLKPLQPEIPEAIFAHVENARFRGRQIHEACALMLQRQHFDPADLAAESAPFVQAFTEFMDAHPMKPHQVETPLYCAKYDFCCTPDWTTMDGGEVWDLKSTAKPSRVWGLQTAAQALASGAYERHIVWLRPNRKKTYEWHTGGDFFARIFSPFDFDVIEEIAGGNYDGPAVRAWKAGT